MVNIKVFWMIALVLFGGIVGYTIKTPDKVEVIRYKEKIVKVAPEVVVVTKNVEVPVYRTKWKTKYVTKTVTVNSQVVEVPKITTDNAEELANRYQEDIVSFETSELRVTMDPWIIDNGVPQEEVKMTAELYYLKWDLKVKNNYKIIDEKERIEYIDSPWMIGLGYCLNQTAFEINFSKRIGKIPIVNIPLTLGLSYALK